MDKMLPLVSIVVATYNGEKYLQAQLDSIVNQTYKNIEIIICDDDSSDATKKIIKNFAESHGQVYYYLNPYNAGVNKNFEEGFLKAKGDFIAISDQDDIWLPHKIATQIDLFLKDEIVLVHGASTIFKDNKYPSKKVQTLTIPFEGSDVRRLILRNSVSGHNIMFRKSLLKLILPIPYGIYYDWWIVQTAAVNGEVAATAEILVYQRAHENNVTIKDRTTYNQSKNEYEERKLALQKFLWLQGLKKEDKSFIEETILHFELLEKNNFSSKLFKFLLKNKEIFFFYKKGIFKKISQRKAAKKISFNVNG